MHAINFGDPRLPERFWSRVAPCPMSGCWLWVGAWIARDYGSYNKHDYAHVVAFTALVGPVPKGLELDHLCRVHCCCNPAHLEPVTHQENMRRGITGQASGAIQSAKTHCPSGHAYSGDNLIVRPEGWRACRECNRRRLQRQRQRRKEMQQ